MNRGQASAELLITLSVSLVVIVAIFSISSQSVLELNNQKLVEIAQTSVNELKDAVNDVYSQGVGARKKILFKVPQGVDTAESGIQGNTIVLRLLGSDVQARSNVTISGTLPTQPGGYELWVTAYENYVAIGSESLSVDKTSSFVTLGQDDSIQDTVTVINNAAETVTVNILESWSNPDVTLGLSSNSFSLNSGQQQIVTLTYTSNAGASGNYNGSISIGATFTSGDENISLPLNAEITAPVGGSELIVLPLSYSVAVDAGNSDNNSFQTCNNSASTITTITFSDSGTIALWIDSIGNLSNLTSGNCENVSFTINVPGGTSTGNYTGIITAIDSANASNTDTLSLSVDVTEVISGIPTLGNVDVALFSDAGYSINETSFLQSETVYYEIRTYDVNTDIIEIQDLNIQVIDPNVITQQNLIGLSTTNGIYQGSYILSGGAEAGSWTVNADANKNSTVSDSNNFIVTIPYVPTLGTVNAILFSDPGYTNYSTSFMQGDTVYYEIRTFDVNTDIIYVTDLNTTITDPNPTVQQALIGLTTTNGVYQGNYTLGVGALVGSWSLQADANRNSTVSDTNNFAVTPFADCANQAACFAQAWNSTTMTCKTSGNPGTRYCQMTETGTAWSIQNTSNATTITITRIMVSWTGDTDGDTDVDVITIDNTQRNSISSGNGIWNNISDFSLSAGQNMTTNNWLRWQGAAAAGKMNNETETYIITFEFSDASTYATTAYNPP